MQQATSLVLHAGGADNGADGTAGAACLSKQGTCHETDSPSALVGCAGGARGGGGAAAAADRARRVPAPVRPAAVLGGARDALAARAAALLAHDHRARPLAGWRATSPFHTWPVQALNAC